ncbi:MAG: hypothetical protein GY791_02310 [Alphaproteobacteria bacterium]|nr:hypothetical protein [Alphaproteobacteria bacterium]
MIGRDKPLSFHWRAVDETWIDDLDLPEPRSRNHDAARRAIILDAALTGIGEPDRWISYSRRNDWWAKGKRYRGSAFTRVTVPSAIDELAGIGLLHSQVAVPGSRGQQSRLRATSQLLEAARPGLVVPPGRAPTVIYNPGEVIRLKDSDGSLIDYDDTRRSEAMRREMRAINETLRSADIDLPVGDASRAGPLLRVGDARLNQAVDLMHRIFSRRSFAFHGRLYGPWWQGVPRTLRQCLTINGESTVELDYGAQHLRMLYALAGVTLGGEDPYLIGDWPRDLVKRAVMALINARNEYEAVAVICDHRDGSVALTGPGAHARARKLIADIMRRHAPVAYRFHKDQGILLMREDSELVTSILRSMRRRGVVVLPIHDSFITDERYAGYLREEMEAAWHDQIGSENPVISMTNYESVPHMAPGLVVVVSVGGSDLFGGRPVPKHLGSWSSGIAPLDVRRFLRDEMRGRRVLGADLARELRISRPQLVNILQGRFGTTPRVADALKSWALENR